MGKPLKVTQLLKALRNAGTYFTFLRITEKIVNLVFCVWNRNLCKTKIILINQVPNQMEEMTAL